jgi:hypothetical protein
MQREITIYFHYPNHHEDFCRTDFFFLIMNKQEYNELNLIISNVALLVSNGDWKPPKMGTYSANLKPTDKTYAKGNNYLFPLS